MTERLYYEDAHMRTFTARVASCAPGKHGFDVVLDRTCFYPEGGGQAGDTGLLGGVRVTDTHERDGEVVHYCESPLAVGAEVAGEIDAFRAGGVHAGEFPDRWLPSAVAIVDEAFTEQNGLVNSTMKVVRSRVEEHFRDRLDALYTPEGKRPDSAQNLASLKKLVE